MIALYIVVLIGVEISAAILLILSGTEMHANLKYLNDIDSSKFVSYFERNNYNNSVETLRDSKRWFRISLICFVFGFIWPVLLLAAVVYGLNRMARPTLRVIKAAFSKDLTSPGE